MNFSGKLKTIFNIYSNFKQDKEMGNKQEKEPIKSFNELYNYIDKRIICKKLVCFVTNICESNIEFPEEYY